MQWVWLVTAIGSELAGTLSLRATDGMKRRRWLVGTVVGYGLSMRFLALSLQAGMLLGVAYGIWAASGIALVALLARFIWAEPLTRRMLLGIAVIAAGVVLVELG